MIKIFDVVAIGQALVDITACVDASFIKKHRLVKGSTQHVTKDVSDYYLSLIHPVSYSPGGTAANSLSGIASLGGKTAYMSQVDNDRWGQLLCESFSKEGIHFKGISSRQGLGTGRCLALVTPDADRTMVTYLGTSYEFSEDNIDWALLGETKILLVEAYQCETVQMFEVTKRAVSFAAKKGATIVLSAAHGGCMEKHRKELMLFVKDTVDVFVGNETEVLAFMGEEDSEHALLKMRSLCQITVMTKGRAGSLIQEGTSQYSIPAPHVSNVVDTTGAGDHYLAGFLYALTQGLSLKECGTLASSMAGKVISHFGARVAL